MKWTALENRNFDKSSNIDLPCPNCNNISLSIDKLESEITIESQENKNNHPADWEPDWDKLIFSGQLRCKSCSENVFFTGKGAPKYYDYHDEDNDRLVQKYINIFTPTYFQPTIKLFKVPDQCSDELKEEIDNSFKLFWCDLHSCANKIRISLEIFMNDQKVKKTEITKKRKRRKLTLDERVKIYKNSEVRDSLLAIKWIGNEGSHPGNIDLISIIKAYRILEHSLDKIYNNEKIINKIVKGINKRKGT